MKATEEPNNYFISSITIPNERFRTEVKAFRSLVFQALFCMPGLGKRSPPARWPNLGGGLRSFLASRERLRTTLL